MEAIAIVGMGCRFPKANSPEAFWQLLRNGKEAITEVPANRWDINDFYNPDPNVPGTMSTRWGGFLDKIDDFDAGFFGMSPDEVEHTDPQQRLFLEVAWEALENAGLVPSQLSGSQTGVFVGLCTVDYHRLLYRNFARLGPYSGTGTTPCITANRLSYLLDLRGPSLSLDAACASSLVTVHLACQSLRSHESDLCLAGGVNLILSPDSTIASSQTRLLSVEGRCKPFDASANGYVRGEGCGIVVLKRLSDAVRDGDTILALIKGSAVNQDGLSNSLTSPNGLAQQALIRQALQNARVKPADISYVEAHAVGTLIGDAIETKALSSVLMEGRTTEQPCWIGSTKPNVGHLEAASGVAALIKVILAMQHEEIPAHLNLDELNPHLGLENSPFEIPTKLQSWARGTNKRLAGISAFGFGGTNAHVVLEESPELHQIPKNESPEHLFTISARDDVALRELAQRYEAFIASQPDLSLADLCFSASTGRTHFNHRFCMIARSIAELHQQLKAVIAQEDAPGAIRGTAKGRKQPKIVFLFPSEGAASFDVDSVLYKTQPVFRQAFDLCTKTIKILLADCPDRLLSIFSQPNHPIVLFVVEYALAMLFRAWGIAPKAVTGHGVGHYVAACIAGVFSLEDALKLAVESSEEENQNLAIVAQSIYYSRPRIPIVFNSTENPAPIITSPEYWSQTSLGLDENDRNSSSLNDYDLCLKMGLTDSESDLMEVLRVLSECYVSGAPVAWSSFNANSNRRLQLPNYPFQRQRYWFRTFENDHLAAISEEGISSTLSLTELSRSIPDLPIVVGEN
jgi:acyl transferase domain-containing protein